MSISEILETLQNLAVDKYIDERKEENSWQSFEIMI